MAKRINEKLGELARDLRSNTGEPEKRIWGKLRASQTGFKFRRQAVIAPYIVDFLCPHIRLVIEIDGDEHQANKDAVRDAYLSEKGYRVVRFSNADVMVNLDGIVELIISHAGSMPERRKITHPTPSLGREGL